MVIKIAKTRAASANDLFVLEKTLGVKLPDSFRVFLKEYDGAEPESNLFEIDETNNSGVNEFIPAQLILKERALIENLSPQAFPFAFAEGGNYVILDLNGRETVLFWDHETAELIHLSDSFEKFLSDLQPFSLDDVQLEPGDVGEVWIDPDFLREHADLFDESEDDRQNNG
ncbi:SMI1 / KNR4 family protein [Gimesia chilikensis]|uniref:SMI1 / KNR4 family protein n=1 Tax=Gimesia chilikensis TaxID=2605989 RepID=A0A517WA38_9PLAN|nr:SMI1/KNR4 family protein [Gimesia chilikensis]QDU02114.1 SMI1 / KNR4 family protein [Gimesia chilikensis]